MDAILTETIEHHGETYRLTITPDMDSPNPLEEWDETGTILSLNRRHVNFDPRGIEEAIEMNPDAVRLSYYEHGQCLWSVAGELPASCRCPFDSVRFAGLWLPDEATLASARHYGGFTRRQFMLKRAREACDLYSQWCNADVYAYELTRVTPCDICGVPQSETLDTCSGFYGLEECRTQGLAMIQSLANPSPPAWRDTSNAL